MSTEHLAIPAPHASLDQAEALLHALRGGEVDAVVSATEGLLLHRVPQPDTALPTREEHFRALLDALPAAIYTTDAEGRLTYFNPAAVAFSGRVPELGTDQWCVSWKLYYPDGTPMPHDTCPMAIALKEGRTVRGAEAIAERPDGTRIWFAPYPTALRDRTGRIVGGINMLLDITERKRAEAALRQSEQELTDFFENAAVGLHWVGADGTILRANQAELDLLGYTRDAYVGHHIAEFHADQDVIDDILCRLTRGETLHNYEARLRCKDGSLKHVLINSNVLWGPDGGFRHTRCFTRDVTDRKRAEAALRELNATLEQRVEEHTALVALTASITRVANEAPSSAAALQGAVDRFCAYTGWPVGHVYLAVAPGAARWAPTALWHLDAPERFTAFQQATRALEYGAGEGLIGRVGAHGRPEWLRDVASDPTFQRRHAAQEAGLRTGVAWPILVGSEVAGVLEFYTPEALAPQPALLDAMTQIGAQLGRAVERERAVEQAQLQQEMLLQREKLAAMSTLLASVAHELNNPLASIVLQTELLREDVREGPLAEPVQAVAQAAARCERLVRQFLTLARQDPPARTVVALNALVAETVELLAYPFRVDNVVVRLHPDTQVPPLWGDAHQLQQVLINLLTNAQQALRAAPGAREVTISTHYDAALQRITLAVADTGPGIPPGLQARIFEPFFTTKPPGVGTGLGLPLCRGIVEAHGGTLEVTSALGHGATFRLTLPVGTVPASTSTPPGTDAAPVVRGQTILVVEDEPSLAQGLARLLRRDGHTVDTVANGRLALDQLAAHAYDLILCDVRMPELDGPSLYRLLERQQPHLCQRVIFLTGDTMEPATQAFLEASGAPCLTKPFTIAEARHAIQRVLRAAAL
jgi:two-component system NtrC family sensor kinase